LKVLVKIPLSTYSGYGNDGIGITRALVNMGADVYLDPTVVQAPIPEDVAQLLTKGLEAPFDLILSHVDPLTLEATPEMKRSAEMTVGWTMWEFSNLRNMKGRSTLRKRLKGFDAVVGYDAVSSAGLKEYYSGPVLTVQGGFEPDNWPAVERDWNEKNFYFCMVGMLHERKDPFVAIQAFSELKNEYKEEFEPARLSLKTATPGLHSKMEEVYPGLRIFYGLWSTETLRKFYAAQHVLLAPSRGEGKNMPALEFMSTGGTVIATNWGGHTQWLSPDYAYPLDYELVSLGGKFPDTYNARASVEHLKELMLQTFRNRSEAQAKGEIAQSVIPAMASWDSVVERLFLKLRDVSPAGERLWIKAQIAKSEATH
jgi:glycosyltransferase involved in cell wall biosynthesis